MLSMATVRNLRLLPGCGRSPARRPPAVCAPAGDGRRAAARRRARSVAGGGRCAAQPVRRGDDQSEAVGPRLGVARRHRARSRRRVVHRPAGGAADEALHDFHQRRSRARSGPRRPAPRRRDGETRGEPRGVGRSGDPRSVRPRVPRRAAREARRVRREGPARRSVGAEAAGAAIFPRKKPSAMRSSSSPSTLEKPSPSYTIVWTRVPGWPGAERRASCRSRAVRFCSTRHFWSRAPAARAFARWWPARRAGSGGSATTSP